MQDTALDNAIVDPAVYADEARYHEVFARLRRDDPVHWSEPDEYAPFWAVTRHADIAEVQRQPAIFESGGRVMLAKRQSEEEIAKQTGGQKRPYRGLTALNGKEHADLRNVTREWFLPRNVNALEDRIAVLAREFVDRLEGLGGRCDFVDDVAVWYPLRVILLIFGLSAEHEPLLLRLSKEINGAQDPDVKRSDSEAEHMMQVVGEIFGFFAEVAADRRKTPRDDLASLIANARIDGAPLTDMDVFSYYLAITVAGHDTTSASVSAGLEQLIRNPEQLAKLKADPSLIPSAVDEMIRWAAPVKHFFRRATQDYELNGKLIRAGDDLMMCYPSACRDEATFEDPFAFRVDRTPNPHLAFGIGPHLCMGQYLARLEMAAFYRELIARLDWIELDGSPEQSRTLFMGGLKHLPVRYGLRRLAA